MNTTIYPAIQANKLDLIQNISMLKLSSIDTSWIFARMMRKDAKVSMVLVS